MLGRTSAKAEWTDGSGSHEVDLDIDGYNESQGALGVFAPSDKITAAPGTSIKLTLTDPEGVVTATASFVG